MVYIKGHTHGISANTIVIITKNNAKKIGTKYHKFLSLIKRINTFTNSIYFNIVLFLSNKIITHH